MKAHALLLLPLCLAACAHQQGDVTVTPLMSQRLTDYPGKEATMILVEYGPGGADPVHRHDAHGFVHVLEGSVVMQVQGQDAVTLSPGDSYYEGPEDVHIVGRNASSTKPAKFLVFLIKDEGAPILVPVDNTHSAPMR